MDDGRAGIRGHHVDRAWDCLMAPSLVGKDPRSAEVLEAVALALAEAEKETLDRCSAMFRTWCGDVLSGMADGPPRQHDFVLSRGGNETQKPQGGADERRND